MNFMGMDIEKFVKNIEKNAKKQSSHSNIVNGNNNTVGNVINNFINEDGIISNNTSNERFSENNHKEDTIATIDFIDSSGKETSIVFKKNRIVIYSNGEKYDLDNFKMESMIYNRTNININGNNCTRVGASMGVTVNGNITGDIDAGNAITVNGDITGDVEAGNTVTVGGDVKGNISSGNKTIVNGRISK